MEGSIVTEANVEAAADVVESEAEAIGGEGVGIELVFDGDVHQTSGALCEETNDATFDESGDAVFDGVFDQGL